MLPEEKIVQWLIANAIDPVFDQVRFGTKKLPDNLPQPDAQVVIFTAEENTSIRAFNRRSVAREGLVIVHTYSASYERAKEVSQAICELLNSEPTPGVPLSVNAWSREVEYSSETFLFYANADAILF